MPILKITKRSVDALELHRSAYIANDSMLDGFGVRVLPTGVKTFILEYRPVGGTSSTAKKRIVIGQFGKMTCKQARNIARKILGSTQMQKHITENSFSLANPTVQTVSSTLRYAQEAAPLEDGPNPAGGKSSIKGRRHKRHLSGEEFIRLGKALRMAETKGIPWSFNSEAIQSNNSMKPESQRIVISSVAIDAIRLLIFTGCHIREILDLTWQEVDLKRGLLFLTGSKTGARSVILNDQASYILHRQFRKGSYVFPSNQPKLSKEGKFVEKPFTDLTKTWKSVRRYAGIEDVCLNDLRHSFTLVGVSSGRSLPIVSALLGHKDSAIAERYKHLDTSPLRVASENIADYIAKALG